MPAKRTPKKATPAKVAPAEPAEKPEPAETPAEEPAADAAATNPDAAATDPDAAEEVPMNRAERRAKGKVRQQPGYGPSKVVGSRGPASAQRNFANRRSG